MTIIQAFAGALAGTFADQWKDIVTASHFDEQMVMVPGVLKQANQGRGVNYKGSEGVISNGSKIFVPENTAAFVFSQAGIETVITQPGGYEYQSGQSTVFNRDGFKESIVDQMATRVGFGGQASDQKQIAFVNLREIRGNKFGTKGPLLYNDRFYGVDLEVRAFGTFSLRVVDVMTFIRNFVPPNAFYYSFATPEARQQIIPEFLQSFTVALNSLSSTFRVSQLPGQADAVARQVATASGGAGSWVERFGVQIVNVGIENIEFTPESRALVKQYSTNRMQVKAYEDISQQSSNIAAQQNISRGVQEHGLGDGGGMVFGMNMAQGISPQTGAPSPQATSMSFDEQIEAVKRLKELLDASLLSEAEFEAKKREIMGL